VKERQHLDMDVHKICCNGTAINQWLPWVREEIQTMALWTAFPDRRKKKRALNCVRTK